MVPNFWVYRNVSQQDRRPRAGRGTRKAAKTAPIPKDWTTIQQPLYAPIPKDGTTAPIPKDWTIQPFPFLRTVLSSSYCPRSDRCQRSLQKNRLYVLKRTETRRTVCSTVIVTDETPVRPYYSIGTIRTNGGPVLLHQWSQGYYILVTIDSVKTRPLDDDHYPSYQIMVSFWKIHTNLLLRKKLRNPR